MPTTTTHRGHEIEIELEQGAERLTIDGDDVPYRKTARGDFAIYYQHPKRTLLEAAQDYLDTQREK